jgi:prophage DNA circulation protein
MGEIFSRYPIATWKVGTQPPISFPVLAITETGGNRIVQHERPFRDGAKLDDTGAKARTWSFTIVFNNSLEEGVQDGVPLYPQVLRRLLRSFDQHETGTLTLPTVGDVRARAQDYTRRETPDEDDQATLDVVFVEDNEDALDRAQLNPPAVVSTVRKLAEQTVFSAKKSGVWSDDLATLPEVASEIEGLIRAPGRSAADLGAMVRSHRRALERLANAAAEEAATSGGLFADPRGSETPRQINTMIDREAQAEDERLASRPRTKAFVIDVERTSIFEIAARLNQDAEDLLELNSARIDDPFLLDRGMVIRVFETAA